MNFFARGLSAAWRHPVFELRRAESKTSASWGSERRQSGELGRSWRTGRHHSGEFLWQMVIGQAIMNAAAIDRVDFT